MEVFERPEGLAASPSDPGGNNKHGAKESPYE